MIEYAGQSARHAERGLALAEQIMTRALRGRLGPEGRLPTERQLAADLGVTRSAIRYALAILEEQGHISREVGRGTYLRSPGPLAVEAGAGAAGSGAAQAFAPADVMVVRRLLEPPAMPLAVAWATAADFDEMDRCLAGGDQAGNYDEFELWDMALHRSIMAATHSPLLCTLYSSIETARAGHMWGNLKRRSASAERRGMYQADHHAIVIALKARDAGGAVTAMRAHLARVSDHLNATDPAAGAWQ
ncbi:MAG TPA: FCD domain-containing protein [Streptosporangiaceae bacterium]|jgi:GntR family transcriptional regulator, uxu operon transcriptional repressor|nr:FCD domain-containing protein [Streptosporangiaceae bacterium]